MAASILLRTISSIDDKRLVLSNARCARQMDIGNIWTKLRIGVRWVMNSSGIITTGTLAVGVCSGATNVYGDQTTAHFVGFRNSNTPNPNFSYIAGPPAYHHTITGLPAVKIASGETLGASITADWRMSAAPATNRTCLFVEITKGSPNFTITAGYPVSGAEGTDISLSKFLSGMETALTGIGTWTASYQKGSDITMAVDEGANGPLNSVCISWSNTGQTLELSDVAYARLS